MSRRRFALPLVLALALFAASCGGSSTEPVVAGEEGLDVVVTTSILGDIVTQVVGGAADVQVLMEAGTDPHAFQASAAQSRAMREADLVVANGLQLEENLLDALEAAEEDGVHVLEIAAELDPIEFEEGEGHHDAHGGEEGHDDEGHGDEEGHVDEHGHDHGALDPHVWMDVSRMADAVGVLTAALADVDEGAAEGEWEARGAAYAEELRALDEELTETFAAIADDDRRLVTNHDAYGYLAAAYAFEVVGTVIPGQSTQVDPSAEEFVTLVETVRDTGVSAIFSETTASSRLAEALVEATGRDIAVVELYSGALGEPGSGADSYVGMMRTNAERLVDALA